MIAILCPTRGRPEQCKRMIESAIATSKTPIRFYLAAPRREDIPEMDVSPPHISICFEMQDMMPTANKWNKLAECARLKLYSEGNANLFMLGADDMVFTTPGWDKALLAHYDALPAGKKQHVYALRDSRDETGTPHIIVSREWIDTMGYFVPPIFLHWFIDSWTVDIAKANGCFTHFKDYELMHIKPSDQGTPDETHSRIRAWGWHERDQYVAQTCTDWREGQKAKLWVARYPYGSLEERGFIAT